MGGGCDGDWDAGHHRVLGLQFGGRARLRHCVRAVPKAGRAGKPQGLEPPEDGVVQDVAGLLQHQQLSQRSARTLPLCNVHRKHHLLWLRLFTLNLKISCLSFFKCLLSFFLPVMTHNHIGCTCLDFLRENKKGEKTTVQIYDDLSNFCPIFALCQV